MPERLWTELLESLAQRCPKEGLTFKRTTRNKGQVERKGTPLLQIWFDPASRRPLSYELEDGTRKEMGVVVTSEGQADFRLDGVSYSAERLANTLIREIL